MTNNKVLITDGQETTGPTQTINLATLIELGGVWMNDLQLKSIKNDVKEDASQALSLLQSYDARIRSKEIQEKKRFNFQGEDDEKIREYFG